VYAGDLQLREHQAAVEHEDTVVDLDARAVAADLTEASEEDDADGAGPAALSQGRSLGPLGVRGPGRPGLPGRRAVGPGEGGTGHRAGPSPPAWPWSEWGSARRLRSRRGRTRSGGR